jgi:hypothetical protein
MPGNTYINPLRDETSVSGGYVAMTIERIETKKTQTFPTTEISSVRPFLLLLLPASVFNLPHMKYRKVLVSCQEK